VLNTRMANVVVWHWHPHLESRDEMVAPKLASPSSDASNIKEQVGLNLGCIDDERRVGYYG